MAKKPVLRNAGMPAVNGRHGTGVAGGKKLDLEFVQSIAPSHEPEVVEVPEFGEGMTVNVRPLSVADHTALAALYLKRGADGAIEVKDEQERRTVWLPAVAAMSAVDDEGQLVFGRTRAEALQRVVSLPQRYVNAIRRIANKAVELSGLDDEQAAAEEAEKN